MRAPSELYEALCRHRRIYGSHGMLAPYDGNLEPPLQREESNALQEWLTCGAGPRGDFGMLAALQAYSWAAYQTERAAKALRWRRVRGGRAGHAFIGDADVPLCGLVPTRPDGTVSLWGDYGYGHGRAGRSLHGECARAAQKEGYRL